MRPLCYYTSNIKSYLTLIVLAICFYSCSLVKIESEQQPLSKQDLNIRVLTQSMVNEATNRIEHAADSIIKTTSNTDLQKHAYHWKIESLNTFKNTAFQSSPKLSLMDTWTYMLQVLKFMQTDSGKEYFGIYTPYVRQISENNVNAIEEKAQGLYKPEAFRQHKAFAHHYAETHPLSKENLKHNSVRSEYIEFLKVPDNLAFTTVGTLSEVMANFSDKLSYSTDAAGKQLKWNTQLMLKEKGFDSLQINEVMATIDLKVDRLSAIAENTPEKLNMALQSFSKDMSILFFGLNNQIEFVSERLSLERQAIDTIIMRERLALDQIVLREREALSAEASDLTVKVVDNAMLHLKDLTGTILFYVVVLFAILLFLPFALGYFAGKIHQKNKQSK